MGRSAPHLTENSKRTNNEVGFEQSRYLLIRIAASLTGFATLLALLAPAPRPAYADPATFPGELLGFGANDWGQLGSTFHNHTQTPNPTPMPINLPGAGGPVTGVATGFDFSLAITSAGQLFAFGEDYIGQLGNSSEFKLGAANPIPALDTLPGGVKSVSVGRNQSLALTASGKLYAFGGNYSGQLGNVTNNETEEPNPTPTLVSLPGATGPVSQVVGGEGFTLALTSTGQLYGFGSNFYGQLGSSTNNGVGSAGRGAPNPTPTVIDLPGSTGEIVRIAAGANHSLVLTSSGQLFSFGFNGYGQLGTTSHISTYEPNPTPSVVSIPGSSGQVIQIAAGENDSLALMSSGQLYAFGENRFGQLGNASHVGTYQANPVPTLVTLPSAAGQIVQIGGGAHYSLALTSSGQIYGFGENSFGQLGNVTNNGTEEPVPTPTLALMPENATIDSISESAFAYHSLAVVSDLAVTTRGLPPGMAGDPYSAQVTGIDGASPYSWAAEGLPPGLQIDPSSGAISGTPTTAECVQAPCSPSSTYTPTFTVTDNDGIQASVSLPIRIDSPRPSPPDQVPIPVVGSLRQSAPRWREGSRPAQLSRSGGSRKGPIGTVYSFSLNVPAQVRFSFGKGAHGRSAAPGRAGANLSACGRTVNAGALSLAGNSGPNKVRFQGHLSPCKALEPGGYTLTVTATNSAGPSMPGLLHFTIVK